MVGAGLVALALVSFVALGLPEGGTGVAWPTIAADLDRRISELAVLLGAVVVGYFIASALTGWITARLGLGRTLVMASTVSTVSLFGFASAPTWALLVAMIALLGAGVALVDAGLNAFMALRGGVRTMNLLHASFGVGATVGPLVTALLLVGPGSWRTAFGLFGIVQLALTVWFVRTRGLWERPVERQGDKGRRGLTAGILMGLVVFAVYTGLEVAAGQWAFSLLTEQRGVDEWWAGVWVSGYWGSLTAGRFLAGGVGDRIRPQVMLAAGIVTALAGTLLLWWNAVGWLGSSGLLLIGFGLAPVFPVLVLLTPLRVGAERATAVVGYQLAAAAAGAALLPGIVGVAVAASDLNAVPPALVVFAVALAMSVVVQHRRVPATP